MLNKIVLIEKVFIVQNNRSLVSVKIFYSNGVFFADCFVIWWYFKGDESGCLKNPFWSVINLTKIKRDFEVKNYLLLRGKILLAISVTGP